MEPTTVTICQQEVRLSPPSRKWRRILRAPVGLGINAELWNMACLGMCWRGEDHPADPTKHDPRNVIQYGEVVLDALLERGASDAELDKASQLAFFMCWGKRGAEDKGGDKAPSLGEVQKTADFFGAEEAVPEDSST